MTSRNSEELEKIHEFISKVNENTARFELVVAYVVKGKAI